jgi:dihydroorotase
MELLLKNVKLFGAPEKKDGPTDILIRDGVIEAIGSKLSAASDARVWEMPGACASPGWMDVGAHGCDPGFEHREDLYTLVDAAAAGGFTAVACMPNTHPTLHSKSEILYVKNKTAGGPVDVYPIGAVSVGCDGKDIAELYDMHTAGAVAFSDGAVPVQDAGLLLRSLQYVRAFNGLIINEPRHKTLSASGQMHEGLVSTSLGLKGIPALAESITVQRDLSLLEYAEGRLHLHLISVAKSVALIRAAKKSGLPVTCSVAAVNLCFTDEQLIGFDSNWKIMPPLRSRADVDALWEGLADGTIDFICSNHTPWDEEAKNLEFPYAAFGMTGLETAFALCRTYTPLATELLIEKLGVGPRAVLQMPVPEIKPGAPASLTLFDPDAVEVFKSERSRSRNTPFLDRPLKGRVLGIVNKGQFVEK